MSDRRVKYTKNALKESLIALLGKKSIDRISIKEICEEADINRSTFYKHYADQYDLLRQIELEVLTNIKAHLSEYNFKEYEPESLQIMERIFEYVVENAKLCKVILGEHGDAAFQKEIMMLVQERSMEEWQGNNELDDETKEYSLLFGLNGGIGLVQKWLRADLQTPAKEIAQLIISLTYRGLSGFKR
ncbi:MAG: TetR/AcrR family transcriptional regulator [Clostridiales Family XIII bacterium]|jgi:AcrR family transcriptional regulator|nr:TetR/AcrR family transcriptional regulator [Clostridiales Family XIII bacterium]